MRPVADPCCGRRPIPSTSARRQALLWIALALLVGSSALSYYGFQRLVATNDAAHRTERALFELQHLMSLLKDAETGYRGFLITSDPAYLEPYHQAVAAAPDTIARATALLAAEEPTAAIDRLRSEATERLTLLARQVGLAQRAGPRAIARDDLDHGKAVMDKVRATVDALARGETARLAERQEAAAALTRWTSLVLIGVTAASTLMIGILFHMARAEVRARERAEAALRQANLVLDAEVERRSEALRQREEQYRRLVDAAPDAILVNRGGRISLVNPAGLALFGAEAAGQILGRSPFEFFHPDDHDQIRGRIAALRGAGNGEVPVVEERIVRLDGTAVEVEVTAKPFVDGGEQAILVILRDIGERKRAAAAQDTLEAQLRQAQRMEAVGQLTGGIAHDFNNLLATVIANLDLVQERLGDPELRKLADAALSGALHGAELTQRLLAFARRQPLEPKAIDLNRVLPSMLEVLRRTLGEQITIAAAPAPGLWLAQADPSQLEGAILNLAINARDAMPEGGRLTLETANVHLDADYAAQNPEVVPGDYVMLSVTDSGTGMPPEVAERAFEPFFTTKEVGKGTGLGLSMVYGFLKQSGGHAKIYSEPGRGTTVRLYLPRADRDAAGLPEATSGSAMPAGSGERILLVEDNEMVRDAAFKLLTELGYSVRPARTGPEALGLIEEGVAVDLLFTDVVMPEGMTGYELAEAAKAMRPGLKVLFTSGYTEGSMRQDKRNGRSAATAPLLVKPYRKRDLAEKIRSVLDGHA